MPKAKGSHRLNLPHRQIFVWQLRRQVHEGLASTPPLRRFPQTTRHLQADERISIWSKWNDRKNRWSRRTASLHISLNCSSNSWRGKATHPTLAAAFSVPLPQTVKPGTRSLEGLDRTEGSWWRGNAKLAGVNSGNNESAEAGNIDFRRDVFCG